MKKSLYVFLASILGALLFLILHRLVVFVFLIASFYNINIFGSNMSYVEFAAIDYFTLVITMMLGLWYGTWLGLYWYEQVYEKGSHYGFVDHVTNRYWPKRSSPQNLKSRLMTASRKLEDEMWELEGLAKEMPETTLAPVKRRTVKRVSKKVEPA